MSAPRRSARIAARNAPKASSTHTVTTQTNASPKHADASPSKPVDLMRYTVPFPSKAASPKHTVAEPSDHTDAVLSKPSDIVFYTEPFPGPDSQGKSQLFLKETPPAISTCHIDYIIYPSDADIQNPEVLKELIARHEMRSEEDRRRAMSIYSTEWEVEMDVASHWLCIDSRILKASPEMYAKAEMYGHKVNYLFPSLYAKMKALDENHWCLKGVQGDHAQRERLWTSILRQVAHHSHDKWNTVWNEVEREKVQRQHDFKPEMGWSSDEDEDEDDW